MNHKGLSNGSIRHYANLQYHRSTILEGVRLAAFRNIGHLNRAMAVAGLSCLTDQGAIIAVEDQMLNDQGMDPSPGNRELLGLVTWLTWEIYLRLLYAELDIYRRESRKNSTPAFCPLDEYFKLHPEVDKQLGVLRGKTLHPANRTPLEQVQENFVYAAGQAHDHYYGAVLRAQSLVDDYASRLRESLSEWGRAECQDLLRITAPRTVDRQRLDKLERIGSICRRPLPSIETTLNSQTKCNAGMIRSCYGNAI